jgi:hypothetical protein
MKNVSLAALSLATILAACSGNPLVSDSTDTIIDRDLPPGTTTPSASIAILRSEPTIGGEIGDGFARDISYDSGSDTFSVDNLGFDGDNSYTPGVAVGSLGPYAVYEGPETFPDSVTGVPIGQFIHRAIYAVGPGGRTEFAIVRTGSYVDYGFGGFVYQRNDGVTLPTTGQAGYTGEYASLRDFKGRGGLEYGTGQMEMAIDFEDFNDGNAVQGYVYNRAIFDIDGNDITADILASMEKDGDIPTVLPVITFTVGPGVIDANGEIIGKVTSNIERTDSSLDAFESGSYYAIVSGANADQVVGVIVTTASDGRFDGVTVRETGGFILTRP